MEDHTSPNEETDKLCEDTIALIKSLQRMLRTPKTRQNPDPPCPCGRCLSGDEKQPRQPQELESAQEQPVSGSNANNLTSGYQQNRVVTSPTEIRLLLRIETWLSDNGVLMVKPSVHRESSALDANSDAVNNNRAVCRPAPVASPDTVEDVGAGDFEEAEDAYTEEVKEDVVIQQLQQLQQQLRQHNRHQAQTPAPLTKTSTIPAAITMAAKPRPQAANSHRREQRHLAKRQLAAATPVSALQSSSAVKPAASGSRARRDQVEGGGETAAFLRKLYRLLSAEMKQRSTAAE